MPNVRKMLLKLVCCFGIVIVFIYCEAELLHCTLQLSKIRPHVFLTEIKCSDVRLNLFNCILDVNDVC